MRAPRTAIAAAAVLTSLSAAAPVSAQLSSTLDLGGVSVRYGDTVRMTATTVTPNLRFDGGSVTAAASGTVSVLGVSGWSSQGGLAFSALSPAVGAARGELAVDAGGSLHQDGTRTGRYLAHARLHVGPGSHGLWLGGGVGHTWDGSLWQPVTEGDVGVWGQLDAVTLLGTVTPTMVGSSIRYTDAEALARRQGRQADLTASVGVRHGDALVRGSSTVWGSVSVVLWVAPYLGVLAAGGTYPVDFTQGFPGGRYLSLALRLAPHRDDAPFRPTLSRSAAAAQPGRGSAVPRAHLEVATRADGRRAIRVHADGARAVEIMGDFTDWQAIALVPEPGGWWSLVIRLTPGPYQLNVRLDGGAWEIPGGVIAGVDEFGAPVGVAIVR
jgi:hypothetical protein